MVRPPSNSFAISLLTVISTVTGCGVMPAGQMSTRTFIVSGFALPVAMVYSEDSAVSARVPGIAASKSGAQAFVQRLIMQTVFDVLERQGRSALLPDGVISTILDQLNVTISYEPISCQKVVLSLEETVMNKEQKCIIVGNTVTGICTEVMDGGAKMCSNGDPTMVKITPVPGNVTSISGTLSTTNIIMANWSRTMWQSVVDRAARILALGPFGSHFFSATATVGGN
ncbi:hypothetical protein KIN20_037468 [Parelaphostrongylus tenuis]|uniref:Uncharacterized protein n=1 Tax=Parelaphostrongylus tenuis TaxID=148309 RepID=A0AAD5REB0_PARTN|nr:hypothetical protein KIN20_037468 [Parelaphostrongylus tenuis]